MTEIIPDWSGSTFNYVTTIGLPKDPNWFCCFGGNFVYYPVKGSEPNWFQRKMSEIFFGVKWKRNI
jgi:hypothetical protein